jgi:hypothetical protein
MVFTSEGAHVVDVVGGTEVGMDFGSYVSILSPIDPWWEAMWDTSDFMGETIGPFVPEVGAPDFFFDVTMETYLDPLPDYSPVGPISTDLQLSALRRMSHRWCDPEDADLACDETAYYNYFTTPTGCGWNLSHIVSVGGPKVNLATEYFNEHTWAVWTSDESGCEFEELADGGVYVFPSGRYYTGDGYSVISIVEDLNLTSWTAICDGAEICNRELDGCFTNNGDTTFQTDDSCFADPELNVDGPTITEPYAGLIIWGTSGWDTRAAANWFAQNRRRFNALFTATTDKIGENKRGVTTLILNTEHVGDSCGDWMEGVQEILGPPAGRWRLSESAWGVWIYQPLPLAIVW